MREYTTEDGVTIREGLAVWTNNLTRGRITLRGSWEENGKLWFDVIGNGTADSPSRTLQSNDRVATWFPGKGMA